MADEAGTDPGYGRPGNGSGRHYPPQAPPGRGRVLPAAPGPGGRPGRHAGTSSAVPELPPDTRHTRHADAIEYPRDVSRPSAVQYPPDVRRPSAVQYPPDVRRPSAVEFAPDMRQAARATQPGESQRRHLTGTQRFGGLLIAAACVAAALWYVPRVVASDQHSMVGTVTSTGVVDLNFATAGQIQKIDVQLGQPVRKGEVLATEYDPTTNAVVQADKAAIAAAQAKVTEIKAQPGPDRQAVLAGANAQLAKDQEQLESDEAGLANTRIVASADGTVVAVNGQPGEAVTALGIRDFSSVSGSTSVGQQPQFSLLPEGPQSSLKTTGSAGELPVVALRTSNNWNVVILIPESQVASITAGRRVTIGVPSDGISGVPGEIIEVLPTPQSTNQGVAYQAVVSVLGHQARAPLSGMSADVQLDS